MSERIIQILIDQQFSQAIEKAAKRFSITDFWQEKSEDERIIHSFLVNAEESQSLINMFQGLIDKSENSRIIILPVEASLPQKAPSKVENDKRKNLKSTGGISREELYEDINSACKLDKNFFLMVVFSTIVAAVGLLENNVAVLVGAMVIAPFLGPNLALAFSTTLGDIALIKQSLKVNISGLLLTLSISCLTGYLWTEGLDGHELISRTSSNYSTALLALASGAAGVLALTSGSGITLVGVMVAVALLPPATTMGIMLGAGEYHLAYGAALLLAVNIVCLNFSAKIVFIFKGFYPQKYYDKERASKARIISLTVWLILFSILMTIIYLQHS